jgi:predicted metal-binding protein
MTAQAQPAVVHLMVCAACGEDLDPNPSNGVCRGAALIEALHARLDPDGHIKVAPTPCLAVCDRPVTVAFCSPGRWSYVIGDVDPACDSDAIIAVADAISRSPLGVPAMADRPSCFTRGVICRLPPVPERNAKLD